MNKYLLLSLLVVTGGASAMNSSRPSSSIASSEEPSEIQYIDTEGHYTVENSELGSSVKYDNNRLRYKCGDTLCVVKLAEGLSLGSMSRCGNVIKFVVSRRPGAQGNNSSNTLSDPMERERIKALKEKNNDEPATNQGASSSK
jgi:hypothetical protein